VEASPLYAAHAAWHALMCRASSTEGLLCVRAEKSSTRPPAEGLHDKQVASLSQTLKSAARECAPPSLRVPECDGCLGIAFCRHQASPGAA